MWLFAQENKPKWGFWSTPKNKSKMLEGGGATNTGGWSQKYLGGIGARNTGGHPTPKGHPKPTMKKVGPDKNKSGRKNEHFYTMFWPLVFFTTHNNNWFRCGRLALNPYFSNRSFCSNVAMRISKLIIFSVFYVSRSWKSSFLLRLSLKSALPVFDLFASFCVSDRSFWWQSRAFC